MSWVIFGEKTVAWFDIWSLEHLVAGISAYGIAGLCIGRLSGYDPIRHKVAYRINIIFLLFMAYAWESLEHYLEAGVIGTATITYWFQGVEFWGNRLITDPLLMVLGGFIALSYPKLMLPARLFSLLWLFVHIVIFPHSMYLHKLLE